MLENKCVIKKPLLQFTENGQFVSQQPSQTQKIVKPVDPIKQEAREIKAELKDLFLCRAIGVPNSIIEQRFQQIKQRAEKLREKIEMQGIKVA